MLKLSDDSIPIEAWIEVNGYVNSRTQIGCDKIEMLQKGAAVELGCEINMKPRTSYQIYWQLKSSHSIPLPHDGVECRVQEEHVSGLSTVRSPGLLSSVIDTSKIESDGKWTSRRYHTSGNDGQYRRRFKIDKRDLGSVRLELRDALRVGSVNPPWIVFKFKFVYPEGALILRAGQLVYAGVPVRSNQPSTPRALPSLAGAVKVTATLRSPSVTMPIIYPTLSTVYSAVMSRKRRASFSFERALGGGPVKRAKVASNVDFAAPLPAFDLEMDGDDGYVDSIEYLMAKLTEEKIELARKKSCLIQRLQADRLCIKEKSEALDRLMI